MLMVKSLICLCVLYYVVFFYMLLVIKFNLFLQVLDDAKDSVMTVSISSHLILTGSLDSYTRVYDLRNGQLTSNCIGGTEGCLVL